MPAGSSAVFTGRVSSFDEDGGWGEITGADGVVYPFHCTAIADGTRTVSAATPVTYGLVPGHQGRWEASGVIAAQQP